MSNLQIQPVVSLVDYEEQPKIHYSKMGYQFNFDEQIWQLDNSIKINWNLIDESKISPVVLEGFRNATCRACENYSSHMTNNWFSQFKQLIINQKFYKGGIITGELILNIRATLDETNEYKLGTIISFLRHWQKWGFTGLESNLELTLSKLVLKGNEKGRAVREKCPFKGAYTLTEQQSILNWAGNAFKDGILDLEEFAWFYLGYTSGRRETQLRALRIGDLKVVAAEGNKEYVLNIPRAKQRYSEFRNEFRELILSEDLYLILKNQIDNNVNYVKERLKGLTKTDIENLPLFLNKSVFDKIKDINEFRLKISTTPDFFHLTNNEANKLFSSVSGKCTAISERTGRELNFTPYRARRTLGTNLARQGVGGIQLAYLLDHSDTQNIQAYTEDSVEQALRIFASMDETFIKLANRFKDRIIKNESEAIRGDDINSRVYKTNGSYVGSCGGSPACQSGIKACLICTSFQPLLDADWIGLREEIFNERTFHNTNGSSEMVLNSFDLQLANLTAIIEACKELKREEHD